MSDLSLSDFRATPKPPVPVPSIFQESSSGGSECESGSESELSAVECRRGEDEQPNPMRVRLVEPPTMPATSPAESDGDYQPSGDSESEVGSEEQQPPTPEKRPEAAKASPRRSGRPMTVRAKPPAKSWGLYKKPAAATIIPCPAPGCTSQTVPSRTVCFVLEQNWPWGEFTRECLLFQSAIRARLGIYTRP